jgi:ribosomal protein L31E
MIVNITQLLFLPLIFPFCLSLTRSFTTARLIVNFIQKVVKIQKITKKNINNLCWNTFITNIYNKIEFIINYEITLKLYKYIIV